MSNGSVIEDASKTLQAILNARLNPPGGAQPLGAQVQVTVSSPHRAGESDFRVNLFLYNIVQDESRRNSSGGWLPIGRTDVSQQFVAEPLALRLYYLLTAFAPDGLNEHHILGEAMRALYVNRRVPEALLQGTLEASPVRAQYLEIVQLNLDIDNLQKIWGSQTEYLRSSVAYEVAAVFLDAEDREADVKLVQEEGRMLDVVPFPQLSIVAPEAAPPGATVRIYGAHLTLSDPVTRRRLVRILFGGTVVEPLPDNALPNAVSVRVPADLKVGDRVEVRLQLDRYVTPAVLFEVGVPA